MFGNVDEIQIGCFPIGLPLLPFIQQLWTSLLILCSCLDPMLFREAYPCLYVCTDGIEINVIETDIMR